MQTQEIPEVTVRSFRPGDENTFLELLKNSFGSLEYLPRLKAEITGPYLNKEGSFIAEKDGSAVGCVGLRNLPRQKWHEIRYLAVKNGESRIPVAQNLVAKTLHYANSKHAESLSAFVPAIQPYVDVYKNAGFEPVRRSTRIGWELSEHSAERKTEIPTRELSKEFANDAADVWVEGLRPYWDWWIEEQGGPKNSRPGSKSRLAQSPAGSEPSLTRTLSGWRFSGLTLTDLVMLDSTELMCFQSSARRGSDQH